MKKINQKKIIICVIALLLIIGIIVAIVSKFNKDENEGNQNVGNNKEFVDFETEIDMTNTANSKIREDGMKINTSPKISKGIEFNDVLLENIRIESSGDMANFSAEVKNDIKDELEGYIIYITFLRKDGSEIATVETYFPDIPFGETGIITATTPKDIATAYDIKIERDKGEIK